MGKTRPALGLAHALTGRGESALVVHTDVLKGAMRQRGGPLRGPGHTGDIATKAALVPRQLDAQHRKARAEGYRLVIEGTVALTFAPPRAVRILLQVDEDERRRRAQQKHVSAAAALANADLTAYQAASSKVATDDQLDGGVSPDALLAAALAVLAKRPATEGLRCMA